MTYTYDDFQKAVRSSGLGAQFSDADISLAKKNPDAGMSILKYKQDWNNATTDEARLLANQGAERVRSTYGNYSGGQSGGSFTADTLSPSDYSYDAEKPTYTSRYDDRIQQLIEEIGNREKFEYDPKGDALYSQYKKQYAREGDRAQANTLAQAAAATGGRISSYAMTAASQAGDYYASQASDKIAELYELAYNKYLDEYSKKLNELSMVQGAEETDYNKYLDALGQYNADRSFDYSKFLDEIDSRTTRRNERSAAEQAEFEQQYALAQLAASHGDYSGLGKLGIDTSRAGTLTSSGASSSGSAGVSSGNAEDLFALAAQHEANGGDAEDYIRAYYKDYGFSNVSTALARYSVLDAENEAQASKAEERATVGYNKANFQQAMNSLGVSLAQGKVDNAVSGIDSFWDKLNESQKAQVRELLGRYGYSYEED